MSDLLAWTLIGACGLLGFCLVNLFLKRQSKGPNSGAGGEKEQAGPEHTESQWHEILDVSQNCSLEQLRDAYRKKLLQYHPDRVFSLGPEFRILAEERMKAINRAFDVAKKTVK